MAEISNESRIIELIGKTALLRNELEQAVINAWEMVGCLEAEGFESANNDLWAAKINLEQALELVTFADSRINSALQGVKKDGE